MPEMKKLNVANLFAGLALLLLPGMASAVEINLNATTEQPMLVYAIETLAGTPTTVSRVAHYNVMAPTADALETGSTAGITVTVNTKRIINDASYLRVALGDGLVFRTGATPSLTAPAITDITAGGAGMSHVVFNLGTATSSLALAAPITLDVGDDLAVARRTGAYSITISAHSNADDAILGQNARATQYAGSGTLLQVVNGLTVAVKAGDTATAEVNTGFRWFSGPTGQAKLGYVSVAPRMITGSVLLDAADGNVVNADADDDGVPDDGYDLVADTGIKIDVTGDLSIGAFTFIDDMLTTDTPATQTATNACPKGSADAINRGSLMDDDGKMLIDMDGMMTAADTASSGNKARLGAMEIYSLCVDVDYRGPETNTMPIPNATYEATVMTTGVAAGARPVEAGSGTIGKIRRNGASATIAYLTVSEKYNQRLIIANRSSRDARFDVSDFVTEDGTTVALTAQAQAAREAGLNMVPANGQLVLKVADILEFTGPMARAGATVSVNANQGDVQIATTQVNLLDGSTDTVLYTPTSGTGID